MPPCGRKRNRNVEAGNVEVVAAAASGAARSRSAAAANPRVLVCVHGLTRNGRDFDALARALSARYRVVCPDVVGRGESDRLADPAQYAYPQYCADMNALIGGSGSSAWIGWAPPWAGSSA